MPNNPANFESELNTFRSEVDWAIRLLYSHLTVHSIAAKRPATLKALNSHGYFWTTTLYALQCSGFIALGRIFDQKSPHNVDKVLRLAQNQISIFSKTELAKRKSAGGGSAKEWLSDYLDGAYEPTHKDFRKLRKQVASQRAVYMEMCDQIRDKIFAHNEVNKPEAVKELFSRVELGRFQKLIIFLNQLHESLWQLYHNGHKPVLEPMPYSARQIVRTSLKDWERGTIQQLIVKDTQEFIGSIVRPNS
jgi:hypothetical protein